MIFGTDGVRGRYPDEIDEELVGRLAAGFSAFLPAGHLVLGQDTRQSGGSLAAAAAGAAAAGGRRVLDLGVAPTPMVSFAIRHTGAAGGIVISASHNPPNHNGIKLFSAQGAKLTAADEMAVERAMPPAAPVSGEGEALDLLDDYTSSLAAASGPPSGTWVLDPAHGALAALATGVFERLGHRVVAINDEPRGDAINVGCGVLDLDPLRAAVAACPDALGGFAFDGDGDRCLAVTKSGDLLDGDDLLVDWCRQARQEGEP
ncbi:phosphoglucosamine mutase, partial [bacterium]|nr:phosphoglucosamine mutase [bacterium]